MNAFKHLLASALIATSAASFAQTSVTITTTESTTVGSTVVDSTITESTVSTPTTVVIRKTMTRPVERIVSDFAVYVGFNSLGGELPAGYELRPLSTLR